MSKIPAEDYILSYKEDTGEPILTLRGSGEEISLKEYPVLEQFYKQELNHERYKNRQYTKRTCSLDLTYSDSDNASDALPFGPFGFRIHPFDFRIYPFAFQIL